MVVQVNKAQLDSLNVKTDQIKFNDKQYQNIVEINTQESNFFQKLLTANRMNLFAIIFGFFFPLKIFLKRKESYCS